MKEKIIKILESQFSVVEYEDPDTGFTESTTIDVLTTDEFPYIVDKLEILVNQEVERRIKERMLSDEDIIDFALLYVNHKSLLPANKGLIKDAIIIGMKELRSRLTPQVEKTEGGAK